MRLPFMDDEEMRRKSGMMPPLGPEPASWPPQPLPGLGAEVMVPDLSVDERPVANTAPIQGLPEQEDRSVSPWSRAQAAAGGIAAAIPDETVQAPVPAPMAQLPQIPVDMYYQNPYGRKKPRN
jgi:hypothetical protein